ncbi:MAG: DUF5683 domain-containing protein [Salinivenus sp.]
MPIVRRLSVFLIVLGGLLAVPNGAQAQPDSVRTEILKEKGFSPDHSPRGALWRSAAVPGWGQVYNRQYLKLPLVYGGLAALGYAIYSMNQNYGLNRRAAIFARGQRLTNQNDDIPSVISDWQSYEDDYATVVREAGGSTGDLTSLPLSPSQVRQQRDKFRRWRDLSIVGTGFFYVLTLVDAYVSAHLLTFDVGGDLALKVRPTGGLPGAASGGDAFSSAENHGLQLRVRF